MKKWSVEAALWVQTVSNEKLIVAVFWNDDPLAGPWR
jgi:hypothetical protein